jgi:hypothetical protein
MTTTTEMPTKSAPWMTLVPAHDGAHDGFAPIVGVRWQIADAAVDEMAQRGATKPYLMILVSAQEADGRWLRKKVVICRIDELMTFLTFEHPGKHRVASMLIWDVIPDFLLNALNNLDYRVTSHTSGDLDPKLMADLLSYSNHSTRTRHYGGYLEGETLDIVVDEKFFIKEPTGWLADWVNFGFPEKPRSTCEFWKRVPLSLFLTPLSFLFHLTIRVVNFLSNLLLGHRGIRPMSLFSWKGPVTGGPRADSKMSVYDSVFFYRRAGGDGRGRERRAIFMRALAPFWAVLIYLCITIFEPSTPSLMLATTITIVMSAAFLLFLAECARQLYNKCRDALSDYKYEKWERERERVEAAARLLVELVPEDIRVVRARQIRENLGPALASSQPVTADVVALPKDRQTIRLKFTAFKARVCRIYTPS